MGGGLQVSEADLEGPVGVLDAQTPYELTLKGLQFPLWLHLVFNVFAGVALAFIGGPILALVWTLAASAADLGLQRLYARWSLTAANADSARALPRLGWCVAFRSSLWMSAPTYLAFVSHDAGAYIYAALTALSMVALAVSAGWISRAVWAGFASPAALAIVLQAVPFLAPLAAVGAAMGLLSFAATAVLIALATERSLSEWSQANERTRTVLDRLRSALCRSEAAEQRLRLGAEISQLQVLELDFTRGVLVTQGAEADIFPEPPTFNLMMDDPFSIVAPEDRDQVKTAWKAYLAGHGPYRVQFRVNRSDRQVWASAMGELTRDAAGNSIAFVCVLRNVTDLVQTERVLIEARDRAEAGNRAKSEFLALISHEIRTPLNGVLGMAQAMERDELEPFQRERLNVIRNSGETLLALLNGVLDLSKIEAGMLELEAGEVDIAALSRSALAPFSAQAAEKGVTLSLEVDPAVAGVYFGDAARIRQILYNLVSNAVKFTAEGRVQVSVGGADGEVRISVQDTGIGIAPEQREILFEKFVQADASTTRRYGGSGLGLAISKRLTEMMGGAIRLDSEPGCGSTFVVTLPLVRTGEAPAIVTPIDEGGRPADLMPLRILAAEDNPVNQLVLQTLLQQMGVEPTVVADGREALAAFEAGDWDLVLMDVQMPVMDGVSAAASIRALESRRKSGRTPIIALTANVMAHQVQAYRAGGMDRVVAKPISPAALYDAIEACLAEGLSAPSGVSAAGANISA